MTNLKNLKRRREYDYAVTNNDLQKSVNFVEYIMLLETGEILPMRKFKCYLAGALSGLKTEQANTWRLKASQLLYETGYSNNGSQSCKLLQFRCRPHHLYRK